MDKYINFIGMYCVQAYQNDKGRVNVHATVGSTRAKGGYNYEMNLPVTYKEIVPQWEASNLKVGGGLDDVWFNKDTEELHIVDYKSTSQKSDGKEITLEDPWKAAYKRQMDLYVWVMRQKGFDVSDEGYFLYCDGDRFSEYDFLGTQNAVMKFKMSLLPYTVDTTWIEPTLFNIKECLDGLRCPDHDPYCEYGYFLNASESIL